MRAFKAESHLPRAPITVAEYHRMGLLGIIKDDDSVELLDGELIPMPSIGPEHAYTVDRLTRLCYRRFGARAAIRVQNPVRLDDWSEPQPDVTLNAPPDERYLTAHPTPAETLLVVEVSVTSLAVDRGRKRRAYARRGIADYWIVNLVRRRVEIYREPRGERYAARSAVRNGDLIAPLAFPDEAFPASDILPPEL